MIPLQNREESATFPPAKGVAKTYGYMRPVDRNLEPKEKYVPRRVGGKKRCVGGQMKKILCPVEWGGRKSICPVKVVDKKGICPVYFSTGPVLTKNDSTI